MQKTEGETEKEMFTKRRLQELAQGKDKQSQKVSNKFFLKQNVLDGNWPILNIFRTLMSLLLGAIVLIGMKYEL